MQLEAFSRCSFVSYGLISWRMQTASWRSWNEVSNEFRNWLNEALSKKTSSNFEFTALWIIRIRYHRGKNKPVYRGVWFGSEIRDIISAKYPGATSRLVLSRLRRSLSTTSRNAREGEETQPRATGERKTGPGRTCLGRSHTGGLACTRRDYRDRRLRTTRKDWSSR